MGAGWRVWVRGGGGDFRPYPFNFETEKRPDGGFSTFRVFPRIGVRVRGGGGSHLLDFSPNILGGKPDVLMLEQNSHGQTIVETFILLKAS